VALVATAHAPRGGADEPPLELELLAGRGGALLPPAPGVAPAAEELGGLALDSSPLAPAHVSLLSLGGLEFSYKECIIVYISCQVD